MLVMAPVSCRPLPLQAGKSEGISFDLLLQVFRLRRQLGRCWKRLRACTQALVQSLSSISSQATSSISPLSPEQALKCRIGTIAWGEVRWRWLEGVVGQCTAWAEGSCLLPQTSIPLPATPSRSPSISTHPRTHRQPTNQSANPPGSDSENTGRRLAVICTTAAASAGAVLGREGGRGGC